jgi:hypothetical protein
MKSIDHTWFTLVGTVRGAGVGRPGQRARGHADVEGRCGGHLPFVRLPCGHQRRQAFEASIRAAEKCVPEAYKRMTDSVALRELAPKFEKAINSVRTSFYNPTIAAKASTRVQI